MQPPDFGCTETLGRRADYMEHRDFFDGLWPATEDRLRALLHDRGHQLADVNDIVQATAEQALRHHSFDSERHFIGWCIVVAKNKSTDLLRNGSRVVLGDVPDGTSKHDVADAVAARLALDAIVRSIESLTPLEQGALFATDPLASRAEVVRMAVRRHRARKKLKHFLEGLAAAFGRMHARMSQRLQELLRGPGGVIGAAFAGLAAAGLTVATASGVNVAPDTQPTASRAQPVAHAGNTGGSSSAEAGVLRHEPAGVTPQGKRRLSVTFGHDAEGNREGIDIAPRRPDQTHFACLGRTPVLDAICVDSPPMPSRIGGA